MKIRLGIPIRMILLIILSAVVIFNGTIKIIGIYYEKTAYAEMVKSNANQAEKISNQIQVIFEDNFSTLGSLASNITASDISKPSTIAYLKMLHEDFMAKNPDYNELNFSLSLNQTDENWPEAYGRVNYSFKSTPYGIEQKTDTLDQYGDDESSSYFITKSLGSETISPLQWSNLIDEDGKKYLSSELSLPLITNNRVIGVISVTTKLKQATTLIDSITKNTTNNKTVLANDGMIVFHPNKKYIGKNIQTIDTLLSNQYDLINKINVGKNFKITFKDLKGNDSLYITSSALHLANKTTNWAVLSNISLADADQNIIESLAITRKLGGIGLFFLGIIILLFSRSMILPIRKSVKALAQLAKGQVNNVEKIEVKTKDEIGDMCHSVNTLIDRLINITHFSEEIGKGNFNSDFNLASDKDALGRAIIEMRNSLENARKDELNRIKEKEQLNWASEGINLFNKILRVDNQDLEKLTYDIIKNVTIYVGAHMGGIYLQSNQDKNIYELTSYIGFGKEKYTQKKVDINHGDIGRCILEKETIFMNDIPEGYSKVSSGLGFSKPTSILIVPLIYNEILVGILELGSLKNMEQYQIKFIEKLAETIASTAASVKINVRTAELLSNSQKQAEELEQQEEEMRQNMEEMQATQEEAKKHEDELLGLIEGFNHNMLIAEYDIRERLTDINDNYLKLYKVSKSQIMGKQHKADLFMDETEQQKHKEFWVKLLKGISQESIEYIKSGKENYWILEHFIPIKDSYGSVNKILCIGFNITDERKIESQLKQAKEGGFKKQEESIVATDKPHIDFKQTLEIIDLKYLRTVYKNDAVKIYNILSLYYKSLPQQVKELSEVFKTNDFVKLKSRINSLKTKMSYMGLKGIYEDLRGVENLINENKNLENIPILLDKISQQWNLASRELESLLNNK